MNRFSTNQLTIISIIMLLIVFVELTIFNNGGAFLLIIGALTLYYSISKNSKSLFWTGCFFIFLAILTVWSLRILIVGLLIYILYKNSTKEQKIITIDSSNFEGSIKKNELIGSSSTPLENYKWQDVHIQRLIGDTTIDTTETILPAGTSVISIRQTIGKVSVVVPYEIPFRLQFSTILGEAKMLGNTSKRLINEQIVFEDGNPTDAKRKLVIHITTWFGDVEVIRK